MSHRELTKEIFHVLKSKDGCKIEASDQPSFLSIDNNVAQNNNQPVKTESFHDVMREEREKQIRADIFLSEDPFEPLKRFFKSKDND